jgi:serine protease inhibitor
MTKFIYMKKILIFLVFLLVLPLYSCNKDNPEENPELNFSDSKKAAELIEADGKFGIDLFKNIMGMPTVPENVMISPISVAMALGMTYNGAEGATKTAFEVALRNQGLSRDEINNIHKTLLAYLLQADPKVVLEIANSIWYKQGFDVLQEFIDLNKNYYGAEVRDLNFSDPTSKDIINAWVASKTHEKIKNILDNIPDSAVMYLINAIYFNGLWSKQFDSKNTYTSTFTKADKLTTQVKFMKMQEKVAYLKNDLFSAVELFYGNEKFSMCFIRPNDDKTISDVSIGLNLDTYKTWMTGLVNQEVIVNIPKFKFGYKELLNDPLKDMGLGIAFTDMADFTGINPGGNLLISRVIHQSFVDVNEKGTEAAAATVVEVGLTSVGPIIPVFKADKPFIFIIREKSSNAILFMGKVGSPVYE